MASEEKESTLLAFGNDEYSSSSHEFKIFVGIDFGTDGSGLAYSLLDGSTYIHNLWRDVSAYEKPKTSVLFDSEGSVQCHGNQAVIQYISSMNNSGWKLFERFKMKLYESNPIWKNEIAEISNKFQNKIDLYERISSTNNKFESETSEKVFVSQLSYLKSEAETFINRNFKRKKKLKFNKDEIQWILTVPAIWSDKAKQRMRDWAIKAKLIENHIENQLKIVYESDCASLSIQHAVARNIQRENSYYCDDYKEDQLLVKHCPSISIDIPFNKCDRYIICDIGGGTCDIGCHEIISSFSIAEVLHPSGGPWGATIIDNEFELMLDDIFSKKWMNEFKLISPNMYQQLLNNFINISKKTFYSQKGNKRNNFNEYHSIILPSNFGDWIIDKLEEENNLKYSNNLLNNYLSNRCIELYKNSNLIKMNELNASGQYILLIHFNLWKKLFNIIVDPVINHLNKILENKLMKNDCKYIFLVGGFSNAKYFQERIKYEFGDRISIIIPQLPQLCVVDGAARYGLKPNFMKIRRLSKSYGIQTNKSLKSFTQNTMNLFPKNYIKNNIYFDKELNEKYIKNCFCLFGQKNKPISINDKPIRKAVYKMTKNQKKMQIEIFSSEKIKPMTTTKEDKSKKIGKLIINLASTNEYKVWIEFEYSDTMLTVYAYPNQRRDLKIKSQIQYL